MLQLNELNGLVKAASKAALNQADGEAAIRSFIQLLLIAEIIDVQPGDVETMPEPTPISRDNFLLFWTHFPRKVGRPQVEAAYEIEIRKGSKPHDILRALKRYRQHIEQERIEPKFVQHGTTFLKNWRDWLLADNF